MVKPSIFSKNYEQQMKRRRINITLFILIIICTSYFGLKYYMDKKGIVFFKTNNHITQQNNNNSKLTVTPGNEVKPDQSPNISVTPTTVNSLQYYQYKLSDGRSCRAEYNKNGNTLQYTGLEVDGENVFSDISIDKNYIVFEDVKAGNVIIGDLKGSFKIINPSVYKSKSTGKIIDKAVTLKANPEYNWARKPHFTSDNKVIYISDLPYLKSQGVLFVWTLAFDGSLNKMSGQIPTTDINNVSYGSFDGSGRLIIIANGSSYFLAPGSFTLVK